MIYVAKVDDQNKLFKSYYNEKALKETKTFW
jgi:hypothetical protein